MFGKSSRFVGVDSYLGSAASAENAENASGGSNVAAGGKDGKAVKAAPSSWADGDMPSFMQATASSAKKQTGGIKGRRAGASGPGSRLNFATGEGADTLGPLATFGANTRGGATPMKPERHSRFSMANSIYSTASKGSAVDTCGLGHGDDKAVKKGSTTMGGVIARDRQDRFGKGSYLQGCFEGSTTDSYRVHEDLATGSPATGGTSAFKTRAGEDRAGWLTDGTYLHDKDLAECDGMRQQPNAASAFTTDVDQPSAAFTDKTARFKDEEMDAGLASLGPESTSIDAETKSQVVYKTNKHGRFSEFGSLYSSYTDPDANSKFETSLAPTRE